MSTRYERFGIEVLEKGGFGPLEGSDADDVRESPAVGVGRSIELITPKDRDLGSFTRISGKRQGIRDGA